MQHAPPAAPLRSLAEGLFILVNRNCRNPAPVLNVDLKRISVSYISSRGFMIVHFAVAHLEIVAHLDKKDTSAEARPLPKSRVPPQSGLFD